MSNYMAELILSNREVLLIGGGSVARRKLTGLLSCGANVTIIAPHLDQEINKLVQEKKAAYIKDFFKDEHIKSDNKDTLIFSASVQSETNCKIAKVCQGNGV
ncbi:MAG: hypothetical protein HQL70_11245, partial [Magnetococcales bacterium]|nr:hypothetical protein [Magnetococcales bacterium]